MFVTTHIRTQVLYFSVFVFRGHFASWRHLVFRRHFASSRHLVFRRHFAPWCHFKSRLHFAFSHHFGSRRHFVFRRHFALRSHFVVHRHSTRRPYFAHLDSNIHLSDIFYFKMPFCLRLTFFFFDIILHIIGLIFHLATILY